MDWFRLKVSVRLLLSRRCQTWDMAQQAWESMRLATYIQPALDMPVRHIRWERIVL